MPLTGGGHVDVDFYHPARLVQEVLDRCDNMSKLAISKFEDNPATADKPWRIQFGCDEHVPGSKLNADNRRKNMGVYFNFLELGHDTLELDNTWFVPMVVRQHLFKQLLGGWSALLRVLFRHMLLGPASMSCGGVLLRCKGSSKVYHL